MDFIVFIIVIFIFAALFKVEIVEQYELAAFDRYNANIYKTIFALIIFICHTYAGNKWLLIFHKAGYLVVALFFLYSGYGLNRSYSGKSSTNKWLIIHIVKLISLILIMNILYMLGYIICNPDMLKGDILGKIFGVDLNNPLWYIVVLIILLCFMVMADKLSDYFGKNKRGGVLFILVLSLNLFFWINGFDKAWYGSNYGFIIGIYIEKYFKIYKNDIKKHYFRYFSFTLSICFIMTILYMVCKIDFLNYFVIRNILSVFICILFVLLSIKLKVRSRFLEVITKYSLEIYLLHMGIREFSWNVLQVNKFSWGGIVIPLIITVILSVPLHKLLDATMKKLCQLN